MTTLDCSPFNLFLCNSVEDPYRYVSITGIFSKPVIDTINIKKFRIYTIPKRQLKLHNIPFIDVELDGGRKLLLVTNKCVDFEMTATAYECLEDLEPADKVCTLWKLIQSGDVQVDWLFGEFIVDVPRRFWKILQAIRKHRQGVPLPQIYPVKTIR